MKWIRVSEQKPPEDTHILVFADERITFGIVHQFYNYPAEFEEIGSCDNCGIFPASEIEYWMLPPELPKENK